MERDLFLSILAMDSYNRGYGQGVVLNQGDLTSGQDELGRHIGDATISAQQISGSAQSAGFYAIAYDMTGVAGFSSGETPRSFRASTNPFSTPESNGAAGQPSESR